jgi:hypothetical protein
MAIIALELDLLILFLFLLQPYQCPYGSRTLLLSCLDSGDVCKDLVAVYYNLLLPLIG